MLAIRCYAKFGASGTSFPCHPRGPNNTVMNITNAAELATHRQAYADLATTFDPVHFNATDMARRAKRFAHPCQPPSTPSAAPPLGSRLDSRPMRRGGLPLGLANVVRDAHRCPAHLRLVSTTQPYPTHQPSNHPTIQPTNQPTKGRLQVPSVHDRPLRRLQELGLQTGRSVSPYPPASLPLPPSGPVSHSVDTISLVFPIFPPP